jgi:hypothetical protein
VHLPLAMLAGGGRRITLRSLRPTGLPTCASLPGHHAGCGGQPGLKLMR